MHLTKLFLTALLWCYFLSLQQANGCTTAIISGKYTVDGRPILLKNRDTYDLENKLVVFSDGKYEYIGLVNSKDTSGKAVWGGFNKTGFSIINSDSYNLNLNDTIKEQINDGVIMKLALQTCTNLADFENLLNSLPKPLKTRSNFGVIDANGGAAYYETGNYSYTKFDVNNLHDAPFGYLIRTNFSYSGDRGYDVGLSRHWAAQDLLHQGSLTNSLSVNFLLKNAIRSLKHGLTKLDLHDFSPADTQEPHFFPFRDFIPRYLTSSALIVQGVSTNEKPELTTMWTVLGLPLATVAIPVWITPDRNLPKILTADKTGKARLCTWSLTLKKQLFPIEKGEGPDYINLTALITKDQKGIIQKIIPIENQILLQADTYLLKWRNSGFPDYAEVSQFYSWTDQFVSKAYHENFGLTTDNIIY